MAIDAKVAFNEFRYGVTLGSSVMAAGAITGSSLSTRSHYAMFVQNTTGNVPVSVFNGGGPAPVAGSIIGFYAINAGASVGSAVLWTTTGGTIASIYFSGTYTFLGSVLGTSVLNAAVAVGDTVQVSCPPNLGTFACFVSFQSSG